jgi:hypothetical protein
MWDVEYTDEFGVWWDSLDADEQDSVATGVTYCERLARNCLAPMPIRFPDLGTRT